MRLWLICAMLTILSATLVTAEATDRAPDKSIIANGKVLVVQTIIFVGQVEEYNATKECLGTGNTYFQTQHKNQPDYFIKLLANKREEGGDQGNEYWQFEEEVPDFYPDYSAQLEQKNLNIQPSITKKEDDKVQPPKIALPQFSQPAGNPKNDGDVSIVVGTMVLLYLCCTLYQRYAYNHNTLTSVTIDLQQSSNTDLPETTSCAQYDNGKNETMSEAS